MAKTNIIKKVVNLNNKGRKGKYLYLKKPGLPQRYYKLTGIKDEEKKIQAYYLKKYKNKKQPVKKDKTKTYVKAKSLGNINQGIEKGITKTGITDFTGTSNQPLKIAKTQLIQPLLKDKNQLKSYISNENQKKMAFRYSYEIEIKDDKGNTMSEFRIHNKTMNQVKNELVELGFKKGNYFDEEEMYEKVRNLKAMNYQIQGDSKSGTIGKVNVQITFTKGK